MCEYFPFYSVSPAGIKHLSVSQELFRKVTPSTEVFFLHTIHQLHSPCCEVGNGPSDLITHGLKHRSHLECNFASEKLCGGAG